MAFSMPAAAMSIPVSDIIPPARTVRPNDNSWLIPRAGVLAAAMFAFIACGLPYGGANSLKTLPILAFQDDVVIFTKTPGINLGSSFFNVIVALFLLHLVTSLVPPLKRFIFPQFFLILKDSRKTFIRAKVYWYYQFGVKGGEVFACEFKT